MTNNKALIESDSGLIDSNYTLMVMLQTLEEVFVSKNSLYVENLNELVVSTKVKKHE